MTPEILKFNFIFITDMAEGTTASGMSETTNECSQIKDLMDQPLSDGDTWYKIMTGEGILCCVY